MTTICAFAKVYQTYQLIKLTNSLSTYTTYHPQMVTSKCYQYHHGVNGHEHRLGSKESSKSSVLFPKYMTMNQPGKQKTTSYWSPPNGPFSKHVKNNSKIHRKHINTFLKLYILK